MGSLSGKIASNGLTPTYVNSATNASPGKLYQCDTSSAAFTVTLPTGSTGSVLRFVDDKGTWATNNLTIAPAATQTIQGISGNGSLVCDLSGAYVEMTWDATSTQWCVQTTGFQYGPPASATQAGIVSTVAQSFSGVKNFTSGASFSSGTLGAVQNYRGAASGSTTHVWTSTIAPPTGNWTLVVQGLGSTSLASQLFLGVAYGNGSTITSDKESLILGSGTPSITISGGVFVFSIASASGTPSNSGVVFSLYQ